MTDRDREYDVTWSNSLFPWAGDLPAEDAALLADLSLQIANLLRPLFDRAQRHPLAAWQVQEALAQMAARQPWLCGACGATTLRLIQEGDGPYFCGRCHAARKGAA